MKVCRNNTLTLLLIHAYIHDGTHACVVNIHSDTHSPTCILAYALTIIILQFCNKSSILLSPRLTLVESPSVPHTPSSLYFFLAHSVAFRQHVPITITGHYVKDLDLLSRDLTQSIIIDNSPMSYIFHPHNAIDCGSFIDDPSDIEMWQLAGILTSPKHTPLTPSPYLHPSLLPH